MNSANKIINGFLNQFHNKHTRRGRMVTLLLVLSFVVALGVFYELRLTALTLAGEADCGYEEHTHSDECVQRTYICGLGESGSEGSSVILSGSEGSPGDSSASDAGSSSPQNDGGSVILSGSEGSCAHTHTDECYEIAYTCGFDAAYNHVHSVDCYADEAADVETAALWEASVSGVEITGDWAADLVAIAQSQMGYRESTANWQIDANGVKKGYTRYGAWYGNAADYADWDASFVSFCLNFAKVYIETPEDIIPYALMAAGMADELDFDGIFTEAAGYTPSAGDLIFIDSNEDGAAERVGIVEEYRDASGEIVVIEGDLNDAVGEALYTVSDGRILGYCNIGGLYAEYASPDFEDPNEQVMPAVSDAFDQTVEFQAWHTDYGTYGTRASNRIFVSKAGDTTSAVVAYCYNMDKTYPAVVNEGVTSPYYRASDVSNSTFVTEAANARTTGLIGGTLKKSVLSVIYNGYPHNNSSLTDQNSTYTIYGYTEKKSYATMNIYQLFHEGLSTLYQNGLYGSYDQFFYAATQLAIWYYTDGIDLSEYSGTGWYNAGLAAQIIINAATATPAPDSFSLDLFATDSTAAGSTGYQDILAVSVVDPVPEDDSCSVSLAATKTMDGAVPEGTFTFQLYQKDSSGNITVLQTKTNDSSGNITFDAIAYTEPGTYVYYMSEVVPDDADSTVEYDVQEKVVAVTVKRESDGKKTTISTLENADIIGHESYTDATYGYSENHRTVTIDGVPYKAYCVNSGKGNAQGGYGYIADPDSAELADAVVANNYGSNLSGNMKKVLYFFSLPENQPGNTLDYESGTITIDNTTADEVIWLLSGSSTTNDTLYTAILNYIIEETTVPSGYHLVLFEGEEIGLDYSTQQPVVIGYSNSAATITTTAVDTGLYGTVSNTPAFTNKTRQEDDSFHIRAKKTMSDGTLPEAGAFTFGLYDENGNLLQTAENNAAGEIIFPDEIHYSAAGTYTYKIKEIIPNPRDESIDYDETEYTVTVTVTATGETTTVIQSFEQNIDNITGYEYYGSNNQRTIKVGENTYDAYCINMSAGSAKGKYNYVVEPSEEVLGEHVANNYIGEYNGSFRCGLSSCTASHGDLADVMRKVVYFFSVYQSGDEVEYADGTDTFTLNDSTDDNYVWLVAGESSYWDEIDSPKEISTTSEKRKLHTMLTYAEEHMPSTYKLVLFTGNQQSSVGSQQPVVIGIDTAATTSETTSTKTVYEAAQSGTPPTFTNSRKNSVTVSKSVTDSAGGADSDQLFTFRIKLWEMSSNSAYGWSGTEGLAGESFTASWTGVEQTDSNYKASVSFSSGMSGNSSEVPYPYYAYADVQLKDGQSVTITGLPDGTYYSVEETDVPDGYVVTAPDNATNASEASGLSGNAALAFTNTYAGEEPAALSLTKNVAGDLGSTTKTFNFEIALTDSQGSPITGEQAVTPSAAENYSAPELTSLTFDSEGKASVSLSHGQTITLSNLPQGFQYSITETDAGYGGYTSTSENASNDTGVTGTAAAVFTNTRNSAGPYSATITANKQLNNTDPSENDKFTFALYESDASGTQGDEVQRVYNSGASVQFNIELSEAGTHYFLIKEVRVGSENAGIEYDVTGISNGYLVEVVVTAGASGTNQEVENIKNSSYSTIIGSVGNGYSVTPENGSANSAYLFQSGGSESYPSSSGTKYYNADTDVSNSDVAGYVADSSIYGDELLSKMKMVLDYFTNHDESDTATGITLTKSQRQYLLYALSGYSSYGNRQTYLDALTYIFSQYSSAPNSSLVIFTQSGYKPMVAYYANSGTSSDPTVAVSYHGTASSGTPPTFYNETSTLSLPQTGGSGIAPVIAGAALISALFICFGCVLRRRKERRLK